MNSNIIVVITYMIFFISYLLYLCHLEKKREQKIKNFLQKDRDEK